MSSILELAAEEFYLDVSRTAFLERTDSRLKELVQNKLVRTNRFRELLLGNKAIGKTAMLKFIRDYAVRERFPKLLTIYRSFDACNKGLSTLIAEAYKDVYSGAEYAESRNTIDLIIQNQEVDVMIENLEKFLVNHDVYVLLLLDEFQFVYSKEYCVGGVIVRELSVLAGTDMGRFHCIVSGSSSCLRLLAFNKYNAVDVPKVLEDYPSFKDRIDLNSTKLQPHWLLPLHKPEDFRALLVKKSTDILDEATITNKYLNSGGRPGLVSTETLPYSLTGKHSTLGDTIENRILRAIMKCSSSTNDSTQISDSASIEVLHSLLGEVSITMLNRQLSEEEYVIAPNALLANLYNMADQGLILFRSEFDMRYVSFANIGVYFELIASGTEINWKEAAALKMPTGIFAGLAEDVALRVLRKNSTMWLPGVRVTNPELSTRLNFPKDKKSSIRSPHHHDYDILTSSPAVVVNKIHKEVYDASKDTMGADAILLHAPDPSDLLSVNLVRVQLKLGQKVLEEEEFRLIATGMVNRSGPVSKCLLDAGYTVLNTTNILVATRFAKNLKEYENFRYVGPVELTEVWPPEVKALGKPYGRK